MSISRVSRIVRMLLAIMIAVPLAQPGRPAEKLTRNELRALIASAKTPADHERIAAYYRVEAQHLAAQHREHEDDLAEYYKNPSRYPSKYPTMGDHCRSLANYYKMAAERASTLADMHQKLAQEAQ